MLISEGTSKNRRTSGQGCTYNTEVHDTTFAERRSTDLGAAITDICSMKPAAPHLSNHFSLIFTYRLLHGPFAAVLQYHCCLKGRCGITMLT